MPLLLLCSISSAFAQVVADQKTYILAREKKEFPVGMKITEKSSIQMGEGDLEMQIGERLMEGTMGMTTREENVIEYLAKDLIRFSTIRHERISRMNLAGREHKDKKSHPVEGMVFLADLKDGKWVAKVEKGEVDADNREKIEKELRTLESELNNDIDLGLYGAVPRKIGESWKSKASNLPGMGNMKVTGEDLEVTFLEVKKFEGEFCAVLILKVDVKAEERDKKPKEKNDAMFLKGEQRVVRSLKNLTDYKYTGAMRLKMLGAAGPGVMKVEGDAKLNVRYTLEKIQ